MKKLVLFGMLGLLIVGCGKSSPTTPDTVKLPIITTFFSDATILTAGQSTIIHWEVDDQSALVRLDPFTGNVPPTGSISVAPSSSTTYTLTARKDNVSAFSQRSLTITVK